MTMPAAMRPEPTSCSISPRVDTTIGSNESCAPARRRGGGCSPSARVEHAEREMLHLGREDEAEEEQRAIGTAMRIVTVKRSRNVRALPDQQRADRRQLMPTSFGEDTR
jgi:hypothetical protein